MREPSCSRKRRTAPMRSLASPPSITLVDTAGCQSACPLKSRRAAQSSSAVAGITVVRRISTISLAREARLERGQSGGEHIAADRLYERVFSPLCRVELSGPLGERMAKVGDRDQAKGREIALHAHRAFQDRIIEGHLVVGEREQAFANAPAVLEAEVADAADLVGGPILLDAAFGHERGPVRQGVEIPHHGPDRAGGRRNYDRTVNLRHA